MGFQDALYLQDIPYCSDEAIEFADRSMELISYNAIYASTELGKRKRQHMNHLMDLYGAKEYSQKIQLKYS